MTLIAEYGTILLILACLFGFFMAWGVGANDVANAMGTSVGSRALTIKQAIVVAMVFEFLGAYLAGGSVTQTIRSGIVDAEAISPDQMVLGMLAALLHLYHEAASRGNCAPHTCPYTQRMIQTS